MEGPPAAGSFFTCTLGEAARLNAGRPHPLKTVQRLLDYRSSANANCAALGLFLEMPPSQHDPVPKYKIYNFEELRLAAVETAENLRSHWPFNAEERKVALIGRSARPFFFAWLGLVYLGYAVLLLSPDLKPNAVAHLCEECGTKKLVYDPFCQTLAESAQAAINHPLNLYSLPTPAAFHSHGANYRNPRFSHIWPVSELDIAYYHHTSGTSGGLPKLLPVTHNMAIGVLPHQSGVRSAEATFSTTPIYHGGVADCFRSWAASAMIWLYPGETAMTAKVLQQCIVGARNANQNDLAPGLAYISCVPVVLNQLAESSEGIGILKSMRMVGVGGAAMPELLANRLVEEGVNLLSRYGTAECGFLLSSFRSFCVDPEWQYLRHEPGVTALRFERQEDGLFELVVGPTWPALSKTNRPDGSYATRDLFKPHHSLQNAWKYHSRADAQITLITGKKFDPSPSEDSIRQSALLNDILIFGDNRNFPGALLFRSPLASNVEPDKILHHIWKLVDEDNAHCPKHAKLLKSMLVIMPSSASGLPKSSKGTTLRKQAVDVYKTYIEDAYATERFRKTPSKKNDEEFLSLGVCDSQVIATISEIVASVKDDLDIISVEDDFFNYGVDSIDCIRIREKIQTRLIPPRYPNLPLDVVYDRGNIANLSEFVINYRKGIVLRSDDEVQLMRDLVAKYGDWQIEKLRKCKDHGIQGLGHVTNGKEIVLITGVTGTLGAHILSQLSIQASVGEIHCLIRGTNTTAARERVRKSLLHRRLPSLNTSTVGMYYHPCNLSQPDLGLDEEIFADLAHRATLVIHAAWTVNFSTRLPSFVKDNIVGLHNLIRFTMTSCRSIPPHFLFCSSTASATEYHRTSVPESILEDPHASSNLGYSRSKWVAENICDQAHRKTYLHNHISVLRIGQLCGDTSHGVWNVKEGLPLMLSSSKVTGSLPDLGREPLTWLPVDIAAKALLEIATSSDLRDSVNQRVDPRMERSNVQITNSCRVYNVVNQSRYSTWVDLIRWMRKVSPSFEIVSAVEWLSRLEGLKGEAANHPARALLGFWQGIYNVGPANKRTQRKFFETAQTTAISPTLYITPVIGEEKFLKMWAWIQGEMVEEPAVAWVSMNQEEENDQKKTEQEEQSDTMTTEEEEEIHQERPRRNSHTDREKETNRNRPRRSTH